MNKNKKRVVKIFIIVFFLIVLPIIVWDDRYLIVSGEVLNRVKCGIFWGDWIFYNGHWEKKYECGFNKTKDGGKYCETQSDCEYSCVVLDPVSDVGGFDIVKRDGDYYYVTSETGICQTHERFLNNITHRKLHEKSHKLSPKERNDYRADIDAIEKEIIKN